MRANIQFLWELEEEIGSPHFAAGLDAAVAGDAAAGRAPFATDSVVVSDTIWIAAGQPSISYGLRGLMGFTVALETGAKDVHSGTTGGVARNPIGELAALRRGVLRRAHREGEDPRASTPTCASCRRRAQGVRAGALLAQALRRRARARLAAANPRRPRGAWSRSPRRRRFEVHGLVGGYTGPGIKTIVPHRAELKLSTRLVPDQKPAKVFKLIKRFVKSRLPDAEVTHEASLEPYLAPMDGATNDAARAAAKATFGKEPAFVREGGSIGAVLTMRRTLKAPVTFLGLSLPEHGYHAINENFDWGQASGGHGAFLPLFQRDRGGGPGRAGPARLNPRLEALRSWP